MNIFLGIPIPAQTMQLCTDQLGQIYPHWFTHSAVRWTTAGHHHLTLHFFGPIDPDLLMTLIANLDNYIRDIKNFSIEINKLYNFPKENSDLIAAYVTLSPVLAKLYHQIQIAVTDYGFPTEARAYLPHITLCRSKRRNFVKMEPVFVSDCQIPVSTVILYQTRSTATGSEYIPLRQWPLNHCNQCP